MTPHVRAYLICFLFTICCLRVNKEKALKCKPSANCACAVPVIDGLGSEYAFTRGLPLVASGEPHKGCYSNIDSMQELIHALFCVFLCLQDTQSEMTRSR